MAKSCFKGYWYCRHTIKQTYYLISKKIKITSFFLKRSSTIPNCLNNFLAKVESGTLLKKKRMYKLLSGFKVGQMAFTRKPYFYPFKKVKGKK